MDSKIINLTKNDRDKSYIMINDIKIDLPSYVIASYSKHQFLIDNENIYLQRQCNRCKKFITIKKLDINNTFISVDTCEITPRGKDGSGFNTICLNCDSSNSSNITLSTSIKSKPINKYTSNLVQVNVKIDY